MLVGRSPGLVGIVFGYGATKLFRVLPKVFLVHHTVLVDDEGHDAGIAILGGIGHEGEAADQFTVHQVVARAAFGRGSLCGEHAVIVAVERRLLALLYVVALAGGVHEQRPDGARGFVISGLPVESVVLAVVADELERIVFDLVAVLYGGRVLALGVDQGVKYFDGVVLVGANPTIEDFLHSGFGIEVPCAAAVLDYGNRHWPILSAYVEGGGLVRLDHDPMHLVIPPNEVGRHFLVRHVIAGMQNLTRVRAQYGVQGLLITRLHGVVDGQHSVARRGEGLLIALLGDGGRDEQRERQREYGHDKRNKMTPAKINQLVRMR